MANLNRKRKRTERKVEAANRVFEAQQRNFLTTRKLLGNGFKGRSHPVTGFGGNE